MSRPRWQRRGAKNEDRSGLESRDGYERICLWGLLTALAFGASVSGPPYEILKAWQEGEFFNLIDVGDGSFFLVPVESKVMKNADKVAKKVKEANINLEDLLATLDEERKNYYKEHYVKN